MPSVKLWLKSKENFTFPLLAFAIPLIVRAVPEFLMAPYTVGFDVMGYYVPKTLQWLNGGVDLLRFIATAPLLYAIIVSFVSLGSPLFLVLKVLPPIFHGLLGLSIYAYAKSGLGWMPSKSTVVALLATTYFVALRISWDLLRNELALIFFFVALTILSTMERNGRSWKHYVLISLAMALVVLAHQLVSLIMLGVFLFVIIGKIYRKAYPKAACIFAVSLPAMLLFLAVLYLSPAVPEYRFILGFSTSDGWLSLFGYASYEVMLTQAIGFFLFCFLPILPVVMISVKNFGDFKLRFWVILSLVAVLVPMVSPSNLRWIMMLIYPLAFYVTSALSQIRFVQWKRFGLTLHRIITAYLILVVSILSLGFMLMPPESPLAYFNSEFSKDYVYQIPTSMLQNTVSIIDCRATTDALQWLKSNIGEKGLLITHRAFYGWALSTLNDSQVILYEFDNPEDTAITVAENGNSQIYLIWWVNGKGWYAQPTVHSSFAEVYRSENIAIYKYAPQNGQ